MIIVTLLTSWQIQSATHRGHHFVSWWMSNKAHLNLQILKVHFPFSKSAINLIRSVLVSSTIRHSLRYIISNANQVIWSSISVVNVASFPLLEWLWWDDLFNLLALFHSYSKFVTIVPSSDQICYLRYFILFWKSS